jgi:5-formyltetrahydrofolate cyclo-ligase
VSIEEAKARQRRYMLARLRMVDPVARDAAGLAMTRHVLAWPGLLVARRVALYAALTDEIPTSALMRALRDRGHPLLLPRAIGDRLEFAEVTDSLPLVRGSFGVLEPCRTAASRALGIEDLVLIPGVAFDRTGCRLGRGGGWYDRSIDDSLRDVFGVAYAFQVIDRVPAAANDRPVRGVFTEEGLIGARPGDRGRVLALDPS